jgi:uncharacterized protein
VTDSDGILRESVSIPVGATESTSGVLALPEGETKRMGVVVAHGAGNNMNTPLLAAFADGLAAAGFPALRFNFLYADRQKKAPDKYETLAETWKSAATFFRERMNQRIDSWVATGKSMGGRIASQMAADGLLDASRLVFLGYPLHPMDNKNKLRDEHLYRVTIPMLFFAGTHDPLCDMEKLRPVLNRLSAPWNLHVVEGGDHSFHVPKSSPVPEDEIRVRIIKETVRWLEEALVEAVRS